MGAYVFFWQIASVGKYPGHWPPLRIDLFIGLLATCVYAMDRVKWSDRWMDPADRMSHPDRYAFLQTYAQSIRTGIVLTLTVCLFMAIEVSVWFLWLAFVAILGGFLYAPGPRGSGWRIKDMTGIKNLCVAISIVSFVLLSTLPVGPIGQATPDLFRQTVHERLLPLSTTAILLLMRVMSDALLCDIGDAPADRRYGTVTLVHLLGPSHSRYLALGVRVLICGLILIGSFAPPTVRIAWAGVGIASVLWLISIRDQDLKDRVDASFLLEAVIASGLCLVDQECSLLSRFF